MAAPPSLTKSCGLRSPALPTPTTTSRATLSPGGATISSADPFLPLKRSAAAARATRSPAGSSALRVAGPNLSPSSQNTTRTPLAGRGEGGKFELEGAGHRDGSSFDCMGWCETRTLIVPPAWRPCIARTGSANAFATPTLSTEGCRRALAGRQTPPWPSGQRPAQINVLLCMLKGLPLPGHFVAAIKIEGKKGIGLAIGAPLRGTGAGAPRFCRERGRVRSDGVDRPLYFSHHVRCVPGDLRQPDRADLDHAGVARHRPDDEPGPEHPGLRRHHRPDHSAARPDHRADRADDRGRARAQQARQRFRTHRDERGRHAAVGPVPALPGGRRSSCRCWSPRSASTFAPWGLRELRRLGDRGARRSGYATSCSRAASPRSKSGSRSTSASGGPTDSCSASSSTTSAIPRSASPFSPSTATS